MTIFVLCMILHLPGHLLYSYILPSFMFFLIDRFVPKIIQSYTIRPEASCSFNADCNIVRVVLTSSQPMKPYYPGEYITVQVPQISTLYHPFTIASYWPEDPYSMTLYLRVYHTSRFSWTAKLAKLCDVDDQPLLVRANIDGVFGDFRHEYLRSEVLILFVAGTAITTFMGLIKAMAAHIAASSDPLRIKMYLIGTFRTRSELHAYGSFLHQITRDRRFTSWLHVEIYVSRPDKSVTLVGPHGCLVKHDVEVPARAEMYGRPPSNNTLIASLPPTEKQADTARSSAADDKTDTGAAVHQNEHSRHRHNVSVNTLDTVVDSDARSKLTGERQENAGHATQTTGSSSSPALISTPSPFLVNEEVDFEQQKQLDVAMPPGSSSLYDGHPLLTHSAADSATLAKRLATLDLSITATMIVVPLAVFYGLRAVIWEGSSHWCATTTIIGARLTMECHWTYTALPAIFHIAVLTTIGYTCLWFARRTQRVKLAKDRQDLEQTTSQPNITSATSSGSASEKVSSSNTTPLALAYDGNWDDGEVVYSHGRMNVKKHIDEFVAAGVGSKTTANNSEPRGRVAVFGCGPEGFVNMVEKHASRADWTIDFYRETWSP
ncbi:hypothetical protein DFQ26_009057 [Actinomortierella ambigua]|nr:hypothetical protein DFQ26_009057 [Actinomortierella ambigua]